MISFLGFIFGLPTARAVTPFSIEQVGAAIYDCWGPISVWQPLYAAVPLSVIWIVFVIKARNRQPKENLRAQWLIVLIASIFNTILGLVNLSQDDPAADYFKGSGCPEEMRNWFFWIPFVVLYAIAFFFLSRIKRSPIVVKHLVIVSVLLAIFHIALVTAASIMIDPFPPK